MTPSRNAPHTLGSRLAALRADRGWSLDALFVRVAGELPEHMWPSTEKLRRYEQDLAAINVLEIAALVAVYETTIRELTEGTPFVLDLDDLHRVRDLLVRSTGCLIAA